MNPRAQPVKYLRRVCSWLIPAALLASMPKCALCLLAYAGLGAAALGFSGPELCGATGTAPEHQAIPMLLVTGITLGVVGIFRYWRRPA